MTTVAIVADEIAWDSLQMLNGDVRAATPLDKVRVIGSKILCFAGNSDDEVAIVEWLEKGGKPSRFPKPQPDSDYEAVVISDKGVLLYTDNMTKGVPISTPHCIGSGGAKALGALAYMRLTGVPENAVDAVKAAALVDAYTGGEIKSLRISEVLARKPSGRKRKS